MKESLVSLANRHVPFPLAASWAGIASDGADRGGAKTWCPFGFQHFDSGAEKAFRVYNDHGYCFAERRYFTTVSLLAACWGLPRDDAAQEALSRAGYIPASYAQLWEQAAVQQPDPGREFLSVALSEWCRAFLPRWDMLQYDRAVAARLARCLELLPLVNTADDCERWLEGCKRAMRAACEPRY